MSDVLSQNEIDSLLDGISDGQVETETDTPAAAEEVERYDFRKQTGPIHLRLPALAMITDRWVGNLRTNLPIHLGSGIDANLESIETEKFVDFSRSLPLPASLNIFKMNPLKGYVMIVIDGPLVFSFVDKLFGGNGSRHVKVEGRGFTAIEVKIIQKLIQVLLKEYREAWNEIYAIEPEFIRSEMEPQFASIVEAEDAVITTRLSIEVENSSGSILLCLPNAVIEPIRTKLKRRFHGGRQEVDKEWRQYICQKIRGLPVELGCTLGTARISAKDLVGLRTNDVISLDQKLSDKIQVKIEGVPRFVASPGARNNHKAVKILRTIAKE